MIGRALRYRGQQRGWRVPGLVVLTGTTALAATVSHEKHEQNTLLLASPIADRTTCRWNRSYHNHHDAIAFPSSFLFSSNNKVHCEAASASETTTSTDRDNENDDVMEETVIMTEEEMNFLNTLALYRRWLDGIRKQWAISSPASIRWPNYIPDSRDISSLETDLQNYLKGGQGKESRCQALEFRIASYYLFREDSVDQQRKGFNIVKQLAVDGHPDALCLYAMIWNHGGVAGIESKPHLAVKFWRQAADLGHLASMYELAVALYMGDGTVEDPSLAVQYLKKAADLGHSGAAYLLVDCYLEGVGTDRNRGKALEWLMTAAEMGHRHAQRRAEALLTDDNLPDEKQPQMLASSMSLHAKPTKLDQEESRRWAGTTPRSDWYREVSLERRFSIGGGSRNPLILYRRKTAVAESRQSEA